MIYRVSHKKQAGKLSVNETSTQINQKTIKFFTEKIFSKQPKKSYNTNKTKVFHIHDIWSLDILDRKDYGEENNRGFRNVSLVIDNFSKFDWTIPLKKKYYSNKRLFRKYSSVV